MSEPDLVYSNDDFDLPRWQTHGHHDSVSQTSHSASQNTYLYSSSQGGPPPPPPQSLTAGQRAPALQQSNTVNNPQYLSSGAPPTQLTRSATLGGSSTPSRGRRHHQPEDLEVSYTGDSQGSGTSKGQMNYNYPASVGYGGGPISNTSSPTVEGYQDMYYGAGHAPKRAQTILDASTSSRVGRSPRTGSTNLAPMDPYAQQPYSAGATNYNYPNTDQRGGQPPPQAFHSRAQSLVKTESLAPTINAPYSPMHSPSIYAQQSSYSMDTSSPHPPSNPNLLNTHMSSNRPPPTSMSTPATPLSYNHPPQNPNYFTPPDNAMQLDAAPQKRRAAGLRRVRDARDLHPNIAAQPGGRRMDSTGVFLSPLRQLTTNILETYSICNPQFRYESTHNPRRVLTKPSKPSHNEGYDNEDYDYILYVNDWLGSDEGHNAQRYLILDILGQGTFGQVVKCQNMKTHEIVAVKVVKNKPAYFNQSMMEVTILELLNKNCDPNDEHHILRLRDSFIHRSHLCLVFELLSSNLYELIKQNQFQGLSTQLVKVFMAQLLDAMTILKDARLIHCDLKPENILLKSLQSPQIKVIDFGSACHERQTVYSYIQSRFYRSPEVLLGMTYTAAIDMWSLGCIAVELFLGLPLFPGTSEYNQITRIVEMLGMPPTMMLSSGKQTGQFFDTYEVWNHHQNQNEKKYRLKSLEQYSREHNTNEQPGKQYFKANSLPEIINTAPMPTFKSSSKQGYEMEKELNNRASFIDFCNGLLNMNPLTRWTPQQARLHPFITGEKFTKPFNPDGITMQPSNSQGTDPKRPYGGLVASQPKGSRPYTDGATYNQQLAQHQTYTAQAQQASNAYRNPYITQQPSSQPQAPQAPSQQSYAFPPEIAATYSAPQQGQYTAQQAPPRTLTHQASAGQLSMNTQYAQQAPGTGVPSSAHLQPNPPANAYNNRGRSNTINQVDNVVPPALARLQHMNQDIIAGRNALTPVLNRDDAMREWERRQAGKPSAAQPYPQLEALQQQAEMAAASGLTGWNNPSTSHRYAPPTSKLAQSYYPQNMEEDNRRDTVMSNVRSAARGDGYNATGGVIASPPQAYGGSSAATGNRYATNYSQPQTPTTSFDTLDRRTDVGAMYVPMQPDQYQAYNNSAGAGLGSASTRHVPPPPQAVPPSFYPAGIVPAGQQVQAAQRLPYQDSQGSPMSAKDSRRSSGMDMWTSR